MTIQTLFIEAHEITRLGMRSIVVDSDIAIASEATSISEAQDHIANSKFDLILTDVRTGKEDMLPWLAKVKLELPRLNILFFSDTENATHIARIYFHWRQWPHPENSHTSANPERDSNGL